MQVRWPKRVSPHQSEKVEKAQQSWKKTNYGETRNKRSLITIQDSVLPEVNVMLISINIALMCMAVVIIGGYIERKTREARNARRDYMQQLLNTIQEKHMYITKRITEYHDQNKENLQVTRNTIQGKMDKMVMIYKDILKVHQTNTPYPIRLTKGHTNKDFANMIRITHWNGQLRSDDNASLLPSCFLQCPQDLPRPGTMIEWDRLVRKFYEESGMNLRIPINIEEVEEQYATALDITKLGREQLCTTPVCVKPDLDYERKECKCQYCNNVCCNCQNCERYRGFFRIRTALINTGKVDTWDYFKQQLIKRVKERRKTTKDAITMEKIMEKLYTRIRIDRPELPKALFYLDEDDKLKQDIKKIALRMLEGPVIKIITSDERLNKLTDELTNEVLQKFLDQEDMRNEKTEAVMTWLVERYHQNKEKEKEEEEEVLTKGGSGVMVINDCNTDNGCNMDIDYETDKDMGELCSDNEIDGSISGDDIEINGSAETLNLMHE